MEHEGPSLSEGTEAHHQKQTWKEKYTFWKRRVFGNVTSVPQRTETKENTTSKGCIDCRHNWSGYLVGRVGITGNVIASKQAQTALSFIPLLAFIGLIFLGILLYPKKR